MPHERITHLEVHPNAAPGGEPTAERYYEPELRVQWERDNQYVQLHLEAPPEHWAQLGNGGVSTAPSQVLDRRQVNHLIRTLRRARDAAYGADE